MEVFVCSFAVLLNCNCPWQTNEVHNVIGPAPISQPRLQQAGSPSAQKAQGHQLLLGTAGTLAVCVFNTLHTVGNTAIRL
jgi:hypothetical protein